jgi:S-adenosylmethionine:diacylglycerol 3-amino-3-carboxypropyl transferase
MFEDAQIEEAHFASGSRVFCIASAGCTAINLAKHGRQVTAVDINPRQVAYVRRRLSGDEMEQGAADRTLAIGRLLARFFGVRKSDLDEFVRLDDPAAQRAFWRERIDSALLRAATRAMLAPSVLRLVYANPFIRSLPNHFGDALRSRIERGISLHSNRTNPFAAPLFLGVDLPSNSEPLPPEGRLNVVCADAAEFLEYCPAGSFHGLTLSNILDGAGVAFAARLLGAVRHAAAPGAIVVLRSFAEPRDDYEAQWAAADRSLIWGRIVVQPAAKLEISTLITAH